MVAQIIIMWEVKEATSWPIKTRQRYGCVEVLLFWVNITSLLSYWVFSTSLSTQCGHPNIRLQLPSVLVSRSNITECWRLPSYNLECCTLPTPGVLHIWVWKWVRWPHVLHWSRADIHNLLECASLSSWELGRIYGYFHQDTSCKAQAPCR